jgi:hypothetical protein
MRKPLMVPFLFAAGGYARQGNRRDSHVRRAILQQAVGYIVEHHLETLGQGRTKGGDIKS